MFDDLQAVLFDIDGVLEYQGRPYPGAAELLAALRQRGLAVRFLTNSTLKSRRSAAERLRQKGFQVDAAEVITASSATAAYLHDLGSPPCYIMLEREGLEEFAAIPQDADHPAYVVVGDNRSRFNFDELNHALRLLMGGAGLVGMQGELIDHSLGALELNVGAWVGMLERASGVRAVFIGKPNPYAFELALREFGLPPGQVLMVGDRIETDILGARRMGLRSALVKTGEYRPGDLEDAPVQPDFVLESITALPDWLEGGRI